MAPFYLMASPTSHAPPLLLLSLEHESFACRAGLADLEGIPPLPCPFSRMGPVTSILDFEGRPALPLRLKYAGADRSPNRSHLPTSMAVLVCPSQANNLT